MLTKTSLLAVSIALIGMVSTPLQANFVGAYDPGPAGNFALVSGQTTDFGNWSALLSTSGSGGTGAINTSLTPDSLALSVTGLANGGTGTVSFSYTGFVADGPMSFTAVPSGVGSFSVTLDNVVLQPLDNHYSFDVISGSNLTITLSATGTSGGSSGPDPRFNLIRGLPMTNNVSISGFSAPMTMVPEPAATAALAGGAILLLVALRRRRSVLTRA